MIKTSLIACLGYDIVADLYEGSNDKVALILHGYSSNRKNQKNLAQAINDQTGSTCLVIDYSGHGDSPFDLEDTCSAQHLLEVVRAFDWIVEHCPDASVTVCGSSYGGFFGAQLTQYRSFDRLVLRAPAIYEPNLLYEKWSVRARAPKKYAKELHAYRTDSAALAEHPIHHAPKLFTGKTLVVVHGLDNVVPVQTTDMYAALFNADMYVAEGFPHSLREHQSGIDQYQSYIVNWLNK